MPCADGATLSCSVVLAELQDLAAKVDGGFFHGRLGLHAVLFSAHAPPVTAKQAGEWIKGPPGRVRVGAKLIAQTELSASFGMWFEAPYDL